MIPNDASQEGRVAAILEANVDKVHGQLHDVPPHAVYAVSFEGRQAVCKIGTGPTAATATEGRAIEHVRAETDLPVPTVLAIGENYFIASWLEDGPANQDLTESWARIAGQTMGRLHDQTSFQQTGTLRNAPDGLDVDFHRTWTDTVACLLRRRRDHLAAAGYETDAKLADRVLTALPEWGSFREQVEPVLCHGNLLPDHLKVKGSTPTALIDFEHAIVGPPSYDYHRTRLPVFSDTPDLEDAFRRGYAAERVLPERWGAEWKAYELLNGISYLRALRVQKAGTQREREQRAEQFRASIQTRLEELRSS